MNLFAGWSDGVFLSTNDGTNWTTVNNGLSNTDVRALDVSGENIFAGNGAGYQTFDFNHAADEVCGPNKPEWSKYLDEYLVLKYGVPYRDTVSVTIKNSYLYYNDLKGTEDEPGFFFSYDNSPLDFRSEPPTFARIVLHKK